jgi:hypothetical protein
LRRYKQLNLPALDPVYPLAVLIGEEGEIERERGLYFLSDGERERRLLRSRRAWTNENTLYLLAN